MLRIPRGFTAHAAIGLLDNSRRYKGDQFCGRQVPVDQGRRHDLPNLRARVTGLASAADERHLHVMSLFRDYHAHVYFDPSETAEAERFCQAMRDALGVAMGRVHSRPVGPHPRGSCQMTIPADRIGDALPWILANRGRLTVFCHGNSGDDLADHTAHVMWLGDSEELNLAQFGRN